jgi:hypothetical protein
VTMQPPIPSPDIDENTMLKHDTLHVQIETEHDAHSVQDTDLSDPTLIDADSHATASGVRLANDSDNPMAPIKSTPGSIEEGQRLTGPQLEVVLPASCSLEAQSRDWALIECSEQPERRPDTYQPPWKDYEGTVLDLDPTAAPLDVLLLQPDLLYACRLSRLPAFTVLPFGHEIVMAYPVSFVDASCKPLVTPL